MMNVREIAASVSSDTCRSGLLCWFEAHPGTAAWLQAVGTLIAFGAAFIAYLTYRGEGFRPSVRAWSNRDGHMAVLLLVNLGRSTGTIDDMLVGRTRPWLRWGALEKGYRPEFRPHRGSQAPPCIVRPGESMRLLLTAGSLLFTGKRVRIAVVLGEEVKRTRVKRLRRGTINQKHYVNDPRGTQPDDASALAWEATKRELRELADLRRSGHLSSLDLWVGRYRSLRRAQRTGPPPDAPDRAQLPSSRYRVSSAISVTGEPADPETR
jgi:hypothetical protein